MKPTHTESDFDELSWHDNSIHGVEFRIGDHDIEDWTSDLVFDIDFIVEWVCGVDRHPKFKVAPATLSFHDVTDLNMNVKSLDNGFQVSIRNFSIDKIERERIKNQKICLDRPYYRWRILLCDPPDGEISFGASGFTQQLRRAPILSDAQTLPHHKRANPESLGRDV